MNSLWVSDLHLTENARDEYRWQLFPWIADTCLAHDVRELYILGDLSDAKDNHSGRLVNRVADSLHHTRKQAKLLSIVILRGNHDGIDPNCAFWQFLRHSPFIQYISHPFQTTLCGQEVLMLPHTTDPLKAWDAVEMHGADIILMHATMRGSLAENGQALEGIPPALLSTARRARIFSGDVHVPQKVGKVEYVGAPYPVKFGDRFTGRAILCKKWRTFESLPIPSIQRLSVTVDSTGSPMDLKSRVRKGDQVKVAVRLQPHEYGDWQRIKADTSEVLKVLGVDMVSIELERAEQKVVPRIPLKGKAALVRRSPAEVLQLYCAANKVDKALQAAGRELLGD